jgi:hypothetical protein
MGLLVTFDPFRVIYPEITSAIKDFKSECILAVNKIADKNTDKLPYAIMVSGGIDSELVAESFLLAGEHFICAIGRLMTSINSHRIEFNQDDYRYAVDWCIRNNVEIIFVDIDIFKYNDLICKYTLDSAGFSPQYGCHMFVMKQLSDMGYFFVAGNGEMDFVLRNNKYFMLDEQREFTLLNFCKNNNLCGEFQFWKQDSRLSASFLQLPTVKKLMERKVTNILDFKHGCFADVFKSTARVKQTGFESIQQWDYIHRNYLKTINGQFDEKFYTPAEKFIL